MCSLHPPPPPAELMTPNVNETNLTSPAGQPLSVECSFLHVPAGLIRPPTVQWLDSRGSVQSDTGRLTFSPLQTSHGGVYTCRVNISIPEISLQLTDDGDTTLSVESKRQCGVVW